MYYDYLFTIYFDYLVVFNLEKYKKKVLLYFKYTTNSRINFQVNSYAINVLRNKLKHAFNKTTENFPNFLPWMCGCMLMFRLKFVHTIPHEQFDIQQRNIA
ncbi:hypothetical protein J6590_055397 [Homalodisca vitripennis]|nr:hypothetical protein J6590_055397 [Homalodisca vitripennis]